MTPIKTTAKISRYLIRSGTAAVLLLSAQISQAGSATWLSLPQDSAWENANNWTPGGPPNGPSDIATFAQSSQRDVNISTSKEVNSIVFTSSAASFTLDVSYRAPGGLGELIFSGNGIIDNSSVLQTFAVGDSGRLIFNNTSTAAGASIENSSLEFAKNGGIGETIFNGASTADHASISNDGPQVHMASAVRHYSMTHQLLATLPFITGEPVLPPLLLAARQPSSVHRLPVTRPLPIMVVNHHSAAGPSSTAHRLPAAQPWSLMVA